LGNEKRRRPLIRPDPVERFSPLHTYQSTTRVALLTGERR
jgi:hypothetical protein